MREPSDSSRFDNYELAILLILAELTIVSGLILGYAAIESHIFYNISELTIVVMYRSVWKRHDVIQAVGKCISTAWIRELNPYF